MGGEVLANPFSAVEELLCITSLVIMRGPAFDVVDNKLHCVFTVSGFYSAVFGGGSATTPIAAIVGRGVWSLISVVADYPDVNAKPIEMPMLSIAEHGIQMKCGS